MLASRLLAGATKAANTKIWMHSEFPQGMSVKVVSNKSTPFSHRSGCVTLQAFFDECTYCSLRLESKLRILSVAVADGKDRQTSRVCGTWREFHGQSSWSICLVYLRRLLGLHEFYNCALTVSLAACCSIRDNPQLHPPAMLLLLFPR